MPNPVDDVTRTSALSPEVEPDEAGHEPVEHSGSLTDMYVAPEGVAEEVEKESPQEPAALEELELPKIPGYDVIREIARGGMGRVLEARDLTLHREVAVKVLLRGHAKAFRRFLRESIITARLPHPGVPPIHALGTLPDGRPFLAMKLIVGQNLADLLKARTDPSQDLPRFVQVFEQICLAVGFAHSQGIIHRDLKPLNVMVGTFGEVQVMDWGLAREVCHHEVEEARTEPPSSAETAGSMDQTRSGSVMGTLAYMPPEQARGELDRLGPRSDVFALGGILCDILTGRPPYTSNTTMALLRSASHGDLQDAMARLDAATADGELIALCKACLSPEPEGRPADGKAVADAVVAYQTGREERARTAEAERVAATARAEEAARRVEAEARAKQAAEQQAAEALRRAQAEEQARRAAEAGSFEQRKRRRIQFILAAALIVLLAGGGVFAWRQDQKARAQENRWVHNRDAVMTLLNEAQSALAAGDERRAARVLDEARARLAEGGAEDLRERADRYEADRAMLHELDAIDDDRWTPQGGKLPEMKVVLPRWERAFAGYGLAPGTAATAEAAARINSSTIRERLLTSLEVWYTHGDRSPALREVLAAADPDPFRNEARRASYSQALLALAFRGGQPSVDQPVWFVVGHGGEPTCQRGPREFLLRTANLARPNSFAILMTLNALDPLNDEASAQRRAGWCRAALAVRPRNAAAWTNLSAALFHCGDADGATAACREAVRTRDSQ